MGKTGVNLLTGATLNGRIFSGTAVALQKVCSVPRFCGLIPILSRLLLLIMELESRGFVNNCQSSLYRDVTVTAKYHFCVVATNARQLSDLSDINPADVSSRTLVSEDYRHLLEPHPSDSQDCLSATPH